MITFELVTLDGIKFKQAVFEVVLPTPQGQIAVFPNHMPLVSLASKGVISIRHKEGEPDDMMDHFATQGGVVEIENNTIRLLADEAAGFDELDEAVEQAALAEAKKLREEAKDQVSLDKAQSLIDRQVVRLKVAELKRHRKKRY